MNKSVIFNIFLDMIFARHIEVLFGIMAVAERVFDKFMGIFEQPKFVILDTLVVLLYFLLLF